MYVASMSDSAQGPGWWLASDGKWYPPRSDASLPAPAPPPPTSSDIQIGPGWWLASDGKWYPPTAAVAPGPPAGSAVASSPRTVSGGLSGTLQGFFWAVGGISVVTSLSAVVGVTAFNTYWGTRSGSVAEAAAADDLELADDVINSMVGLGSIGGLVIFILIIIWTNQAHKATEDLQPGPRSWSSGWTVGGWFIPLANAVIPKIVINEIERIALAPRAGGVVTGEWRNRSTLWIGWVWWMLFIIGTLIATIGVGMFDDVGGTPGSWRAGYWLVAVGYAGVAASSVFGALYVRRIGQALRST